MAHDDMESTGCRLSDKSVVRKLQSTDATSATESIINRYSELKSIKIDDVELLIGLNADCVFETCRVCVKLQLTACLFI